jgi:anti-sigma factor RsiW
MTEPIAQCAAFEDVIDDYVDGRLEGDPRRRLESHLETCAGCRALAADLRAIRRTAGTLDRRIPSRDVWTRIASQLAASSAPAARPRPRWLMPLAAAAVLAVAVASGVYMKSRLWPSGARTTIAPQAHVDEPATSTSSVAPAPEDLARTVEAEMQMAEAHYEKAIAGLEQIAKSEEKTLDPQLAATLRKNLGVIDQAISESRAALKSQPDSEPAQASLFEAFRDKLTLLQDTVALINEMRKGNQAETARIVGGMR